MKIATTLNYAAGFRESAQQVPMMEKAGLDMVWVAEAYGFDAPSQMGYLAGLTERVEIGSAILPIYSRSPALIAMTAAGVDALSDGRCNLGLGASGPQVIEGWHGIPYEAPIARTREIVTICRQIWERREPLNHQGRYYQMPLGPDKGTGLGKPLKIIAHPVRSHIPIWLASLGENNVAMTAEIADGWIPSIFVPEKAGEVWGGALAAGARRRDTNLGPLQIAAGGLVAIGETAEFREARDLARSTLALYIGGMGARGRNFYNDVVCKYGFASEAAEIQDLYLSGKKTAAESLVPQELLDSTTLCGPPSWVAERIAALREAGVTHLLATPVPLRDQTPSDVIDQLRSLVP